MIYIQSWGSLWSCQFPAPECSEYGPCRTEAECAGMLDRVHQRAQGRYCVMSEIFFSKELLWLSGLFFTWAKGWLRVFNLHISQPVRGEQGGREVILPNKCSFNIEVCKASRNRSAGWKYLKVLIKIIIPGKLLSYWARTSQILSTLPHQGCDIMANMKLKIKRSFSKCLLPSSA